MGYALVCNPCRQSSVGGGGMNRKTWRVQRERALAPRETSEKAADFRALQSTGRTDTVRLERMIAERKAEFVAEARAWLQRDVASDFTPTALDRDTVRAQTLGVVAILTVDLFMWSLAIAVTYGLSAYYGPVFSFGLFFIFGSIFRLFDEHRSREHSRRLYTRYLVGSGVSAAAALVVMLATPQIIASAWVPDDMLITLEMVSKVATVACALLVSVCGALLLRLRQTNNWSARKASEIETLDEELVFTTEVVVAESVRFERLFSSPSETGSKQPSLVMVPSPNEPAPALANPPAVLSSSEAGSTRAGLLVVLAFLTASLGACGGLQNNRTARSDVDNRRPVPAATGLHVRPVASGTILDIAVDISESDITASREEAVDTLFRELPEVIERFGVMSIEIRHFAEDGWTLGPVLRLELPAYPMSDDAPSTQSPIKPIQDRQEANRARSEARARAEWSETVDAELRRIDRSIFFPQSQKARCTSVNSAVARSLMSAKGSGSRRIVIVITDGAESCESQLKAQAKPTNVDLIFLVVAKSKTAERLQNETFDRVRDRLLVAMPWSIVVPAFASANFCNLIDRANGQPNVTISATVPSADAVALRIP